ncbi:205_t:CDS:2, partial [Gigaspora margarita]
EHEEELTKELWAETTWVGQGEEGHIPELEDEKDYKMIKLFYFQKYPAVIPDQMKERDLEEVKNEAHTTTSKNLEPGITQGVYNQSSTRRPSSYPYEEEPNALQRATIAYGKMIHTLEQKEQIKSLVHAFYLGEVLN